MRSEHSSELKDVNLIVSCCVKICIKNLLFEMKMCHETFDKKVTRVSIKKNNNNNGTVKDCSKRFLEENF